MVPKFYIERNSSNKAAFLLHQTVEAFLPLHPIDSNTLKPLMPTRRLCRSGSTFLTGKGFGGFRIGIVSGRLTEKRATRIAKRDNKFMRHDVDHLPLTQQAELARVLGILMDEFAVAISHATQPWKKNGKILKVILFGSYARNDWIDEPANGNQSDFDILIIVSHRNLTDVAEYWYVAEDKIQRDAAIARPVNIIVHTLAEVNEGLRRGEYFWVDIARDGIALYELAGLVLVTPRPLTAADAYVMAGAYLADWLSKVDVAMEGAEFYLSKGHFKDAAFTLHQAVERAYNCFLLVRTHYVPRSHNLKFLRSLSEDKEPRLIDSWPRATKEDRRRFELTKRAYVEARYSTSYEIGVEDLQAIMNTVRHLRDTVEAVSRAWLDDLRLKAGVSS